MKTQKIITAFALATVIGAAAPAVADGNGGRFPGEAVEHLTMELQSQHTVMNTESVGAYSTARFPGLKVEQLTREIEEMDLDTDAEPVTTDAPVYG